MGEYADYMLNGDDCQVCGEYLGEGDGFPRTCAGCGGDAEFDDFDDAPPKKHKHNIDRWFHFNNKKGKGDGPALDEFLAALDFDHSPKKGKRDRTGKLVIFLHKDGSPVAAVRCEDQYYQGALAKVREKLQPKLNGENNGI